MPWRCSFLFICYLPVIHIATEKLEEKNLFIMHMRAQPWFSVLPLLQHFIPSYHSLKLHHYLSVQKTIGCLIPLYVNVQSEGLGQNGVWCHSNHILTSAKSIFFYAFCAVSVLWKHMWNCIHSTGTDLGYQWLWVGGVQKCSGKSALVMDLFDCYGDTLDLLQLPLRKECRFGAPNWLDLVVMSGCRFFVFFCFFFLREI